MGRRAVFDQVMLKILRQWLNPGLRPDAARADGPYRNRSLPLPAGIIIAEQGLCHQPEAASGRAVTALLDEAYVVMQLDNRSRWYATWQPYPGNWDLLHLDEEEDETAIEPITLLSRPAEDLVPVQFEPTLTGT